MTANLTLAEANTLAVLAAGDRPTWTLKGPNGNGGSASDYTGPPSDEGFGIPLTRALRTLIGVDLRADVHRRRAVVTITYDALSSYTVTLNGNNHVTPAGSDLLDTLGDIVTTVTAVSGFTAQLIDLDGDGTNDAVEIVGDEPTNYSIGVSVTGGSATIACVADAMSATVRAFGRFGGASTANVPTGWRQLYRIDGAPAVWTIDWRGLGERLDTSGYRRCYVQVEPLGHPDDGTTVTYTVDVHYGPTTRED